MEAKIIGLLLTVIAIENLFRIRGLILAQFPPSGGNADIDLREITFATICVSVLFLFIGTLGFWAEQPAVLIGGALLVWTFWTMGIYVLLGKWGYDVFRSHRNLVLAFALLPFLPLAMYAIFISTPQQVLAFVGVFVAYIVIMLRTKPA